ncbi:aspartate kinase [Guptibacillus hwajinpoensis]|uniref:aspartate kinase n=1 Tax=Guptibacillus hwajinpoensis TaxID=208199 RepID=UPI001CFDFFC4|nr:aspartate kinase [Pseudalkalibacillus hwajinpoensis]WLR60754.1 aspartate kinase [Pseudalkalibacillus hwajinpoensis]
MGLRVLKFGGTSVGDVEKIKNVSKRLMEAVNNGDEVVAVVSAMGKTTDELLGLSKGITATPSARELDMLLTTGEQVTTALLSMALNEEGYNAISLTGWQAGIKTESLHGNARILDIDASRMNQHLAEGKIVIVAGFQGLTDTSDIATLGRGGSDTTAVAIAAALKADRCEIYTDVDGVYTTDPRYVKGARKLSTISYDEMLELANLGAGVLHPRAVEFAKNYNILLEVRSSFTNEPGTLIEEVVSMEQNLVVRGLAFESNVTKITISGLPNEITTLPSLFSSLAANGINVDVIIQSTGEKNTTSISFSIETASLELTLDVLRRIKVKLPYEHIYHESELAKVSIVGSGMISNPGVAAQMFEVLAEHGVEMKMVSTSEIKVSTIVPEDKMIYAIESLHDKFQLDERTPVKQM